VLSKIVYTVPVTGTGAPVIRSRQPATAKLPSKQAKD